RAERLAWRVPESTTAAPRGRSMVFPGPTVGRKGAYEARRVAVELGLRVAVVGSVLEDEGVWSAVEHERRGFDDDWLAGAAVVVAPSWVEHRPRRLLEAVARGVPVVASEACGLTGVAGVVEVATGDTDALCDAVAGLL